VARGLLVGRFQPFHRGHLRVVETIGRKRPDEALLLVIGSAEESYTWKNPFTAGERFEMIDRSLDPRTAPRTHVVPVADIRRHAQWVRYLESQLPVFERVYTNNPLTRLLFERAGYTVEGTTLIDRTRLEGERIRAALAADRGWRTRVPPAVAEYLAEIEAPRRLAMLRSEGPSHGRARSQ
jgi:nicotinamide-nucleotide adenylyltransferase